MWGARLHQARTNDSYYTFCSCVIIRPSADRLGLWDAACVANGALDAQGVIDGAPPRLGVLCWDLSQLDVDANLVLPHVLWDVCNDDVLVDGCLCPFTFVSKIGVGFTVETP